MAPCHQQRLLGSTTTKSTSWADGGATHTSYTSTACRLSCFPFHPAFTGPFHMVSFTSLCLSTSHLRWLEHVPILGARKSRGNNKKLYLFANTDDSIDKQTLQCMCSMREVTWSRRVVVPGPLPKRMSIYD